MTAIKERCRQARGGRWLADLGRDLRYAFRVLRASPVFAAASILSLALGIGANAAIFTLVDAVLLRPLPVPAPHELVVVSEVSPSRQGFSLTSTDFEILRQSRALAGLCAFRPWSGFRIATAAGAQFAAGQLASANCLDVLRVPTVLGRPLVESDDRPNAPPVAVISYDFWQQFFRADPLVVGRPLLLSGLAFTVVGVTPRGFFGLEPGRNVQITVPLSTQPIVMPGTPLATMPGARWLRLIGRLAAGVTADRAEADLQRLRRAVLDTSNATLRLTPGAQGINDLGKQFSLPLRLTLAGVALLLIVSSVNLATLMLARAQARDHEIVMRLALGASRARVARQLFTEAFTLSAIGSVVALPFAFWTAQALVALVSRGRTPILLDLSLNPRTVGFSACLACVTALLVGVWPSLRATDPFSSTDVTAGVRTASSVRARRLAPLIAAQGAVQVILLVAAGLLGRSLANLSETDLGYRKGTVVLVSVRPAVSGIPEDRVAALYASLQDAFSTVPGVQSVSAAMDIPVGGLSWSAGIIVPGHEPRKDDPAVFFNFVGPRFFETLGIDIIAGRDISATDSAASPPIAVVSESVARRYFGERNALGEFIQVQGKYLEVVGIVSDVHFRSPRREAEAVVYRPYVQQLHEPAAVEELTFALRTHLPEQRLLESVRAATARVAPDLPLYSTSTLDAQFDASVVTERMLAAISGTFGGLGLLIVVIGTCGTLTYAAGQRTRELGVRSALGATRHDIVMLLVKVTLTPLCIGILVGVPLSVTSTRLLRHVLFGTDTTDARIYAGAILILLTTGLAASIVPALRAASVDPTVALRNQ